MAYIKTILGFLNWYSILAVTITILIIIIVFMRSTAAGLKEDIFDLEQQAALLRGNMIQEVESCESRIFNALNRKSFDDAQKELDSLYDLNITVTTPGGYTI